MPNLMEFISSFFSLLRNWFGFLIFLLILFMVIDSLTGFLVAVKKDEYISQDMKMGTSKKFGTMSFILVSVLIDAVIKQICNFFSLDIKYPLFFTVFVISINIIIEFVSIIENIRAIISNNSKLKAIIRRLFGRH